MAEAVAQADLAATAVGVNVLAKVAPGLAEGLRRRFDRDPERPLNIIVCENMIDAGPYLRARVKEHLPAAYHEALDARVGFVEASIGRMVPVMTPEMKAEDPLLVCVEAYCDLPVDAAGFKGPVPPLAHMQPRSNFKSYVERKLFVHNAGHASTAYLGYLRGHEYVWQAIGDPRVRAEVDKAMGETRAGLVRKHGFAPEELDAHWEDLTRRFANRALGDTVARVAGDPLRKLGPRDRLVGAALMCLEQGVSPRHVAFATAAAIRYDHASDVSAQRLREVYRQHGLDGVLMQICHVLLDSPLAGLIREGDQRLQREGWIR
ncbi:MAG: mannitol dehydrogenase [Candidatus Hydrogenedentes bacterium]|nr:mannitol dehydrogenase [Candidatus Hydrogenedentota bacterium]